MTNIIDFPKTVSENHFDYAALQSDLVQFNKTIAAAQLKLNLIKIIGLKQKIN